MTPGQANQCEAESAFGLRYHCSPGRDARASRSAKAASPEASQQVTARSACSFACTAVEARHTPTFHSRQSDACRQAPESVGPAPHRLNRPRTASHLAFTSSIVLAEPVGEIGWATNEPTAWAAASPADR